MIWLIAIVVFWILIVGSICVYIAYKRVTADNRIEIEAAEREAEIKKMDFEIKKEKWETTTGRKWNS